MSGGPALLRNLPADDGDLASLTRRVEALEHAVAKLSRPRPLADFDREWMAWLLPAIAAAAGDGVFALPDLAALALLPGHEALAAALAPRAARPGGLRALGMALARCSAGGPVNGFELRMVGTSRDGRLWQVNKSAKYAPVVAQSVLEGHD